MGENYIWLIIVAVFVFFVIIGFIADKTGLARKTFEKTPSKVPSISKKNSSTIQNVESSDLPISETEQVLLPVEDAGFDDIQSNVGNNFDDAQMDNLYLNEEDIVNNNEIATDINEENISDENLNNNVDNDELVVSDEEETVEQEEDVPDSDEIDNSGLESDIIISDIENSDTDSSNVLPEETVDEDLYQPLDDISFDSTIDEDNTDISDNTEDDVWKLDDVAKVENDDDLVLPDLEDLNDDLEEDVWKF